jgi:hypothetical protein
MDHRPLTLPGQLLLSFKKAGVPVFALLLTILVLGIHAWKYPGFAAFHDGADQGRYLTAARAWTRLDLSPGQHHYLPLYPLMGAAFLWLTPWQPFMLPDLLCLLASLLIFVRIGRRLAPGWPDAATAACFTAAVLSGKWLFFWLWVIPWTSTGAAPLQLGAVLLAMMFGERPSPGRAAALGACIGLVAGFRPSDAAVLSATCGPYIAIALLRVGATPRGWAMTAGAGASGLLGGVLPWAVAHAAIFGASPGAYLQKVAAIGFEWRLLPMRWVTLAIDPRPLMPTGNGVAEVLPWVIPGVAGMILGLMPRPGHRIAPAALAAATVVLHWCLYLCYRDLNAEGLWRFALVHYFKWTFPFLTLWAAQFALALAAGRSTSARALLAAALALPLFAWRPVLRKPEPVRVDVSSPDRLALSASPGRLNQALFLDLAGSWDAIHGGRFTLDQAGRQFASELDFKVMPLRAGALLFPLRPLPEGPADLTLPPAVTLRTASPAMLLKQALAFGIPCGIATCRP